MAIAGTFSLGETTLGAVPNTMLAAVYRGINDVRLETVPVPKIGPGELLIQVHTCGICGTDLKKIATGSHSAPRIFGHETSGRVAAVGAGVNNFQPGDRVMVFHHIPCRECYYCRHKTFAQCETYKKVGCTAGFEPSGGGFAEYVRVMDWIVEKGTVRIPDGVSYEQACFVEPVNTCLKGIENLALRSGETVLVIGQGPIGIILGTLAKRAGATVVTTDLYPQRLTIARDLGLTTGIDASRADATKTVREMTEGRGADAAILAVGGSSLIRPAMDAVRPGGRVLLFAQTARGEVTIDPAAVCVDEKTLLGSYSASVELQQQSVDFVMGREMDLERLISHRFSLAESQQGLNLAAHPQPDSMKIVIQPRQFMGGNITVNGKMTAAVLYGKEDVKIEKVPIPRVGDGEVLVKVQVALTCGTDLKVYQRGYHARMIVPPALFGHELAGVIEEIGPGVRGFKKGMRVVALNSAPCQTCFYCSKHQENLCEDLMFNNGAYAEYIRIPRRIVEQNMLAIPQHMSYEEAAMIEPLACVLRGLHETKVEIGDTVTIIGGGPIGLMFVQVAKAIGCKVISVVKRDGQVEAAKHMGAHEVVQIGKVPNPVEAVRMLSPERRGSDVVVEAVGRPEAWEWAIDMVRKGGTVNLFGGCANGTKVQLDTTRLHYSEITLKATFHHTPETVRRAFALMAEKKIRSTDYITGEAPLSRLQQVLRHMLNRNGDIKTAIIPGH